MFKQSIRFTRAAAIAHRCCRLGNCLCSGHGNLAFDKNDALQHSDVVVSASGLRIVTEHRKCMASPGNLTGGGGGLH